MACLPLDAEQQKLAEAYIPWARKLAKPSKESNPRHRDVIEGVAMEALVEAAATFDGGIRGYNDQPASFESWARIKVVGRVKNYLKAEHLRKRKARPLASLGSEEVDTTTVLDQLAAAEARSEAERRVADVLGRLAPADAGPLRLVYLDGHSIHRAAALMGLNAGEFLARLNRSKAAARAAGRG